jgi:3'-5' exoribonuclease
MFPEALMLHYLDDLDSKMESMRAHFEREAGNDSNWTSYNPSLGRTLLNTEKFLKKKEAVPEDASQPEQSAVSSSNGSGSALPFPAVPFEEEKI